MLGGYILKRKNKKYKKLRKSKFIRLKTIKLLFFGVFILIISVGLIAIDIFAHNLFNLDIFPGNLSALQSKTDEPIKWVDFDVPYSVLEKTMNLDIKSYGSENHLMWTELLAYLGAKYGGDFKQYKAKDLDNLVEKLNSGETIEHLTKRMKCYDYYKEAYTAILSGFIGKYKIQVPIEGNSEVTENKDLSLDDLGFQTDCNLVWQSKYGLKAFSPIAQGYWYDDYDDFGAGRSYGYNRKHFGHDLMVSIGTPIIAIESGTVEAMGWNQYGGWRVGIRSYDKKRYYYYAHLRRNRPYSADLCIGKAVKAGEVIGYSGRTGYSAKENVNNIDTPHLHVGMQLIFDESLKDSPNQIWIDLYSITRLLSQNKSPVYKNEMTKEYYRQYDFWEPDIDCEDVVN